jgi:hypothetical protein
VESLDKVVDRANGIVLADPVFQAFRKQRLGIRLDEPSRLGLFQGGARLSFSTTLLRLGRSPGPLHKRLHLLRSKAAVFVGIHRLEDALVSRLKLLQ